MHGIELGTATGRRLVGVIRARCGWDREEEGARSVVRLLEGAGNGKKIREYIKGLGKIIMQGEKEKGTNDDIRQGKINWTEKNTRNGEPPGPEKGAKNNSRPGCREGSTG